MKSETEMRITYIRFVLNYSLLFIAIFTFTLFIDAFQSDAWATGGLPSQKSRFQGMGSTLKAQKEGSIAIPFMDSGSDEKKTDDDLTIQDDSLSTYFKLHTFVVNVVDSRYEDQLLFLTLEVFCKISDADDKWLIDNHIAPIKDAIISYTSGLNRQTIQTQKQKKALQKELTLRVSNRLKKLTGKKVISDLYLTRIIIQ